MSEAAFLAAILDRPDDDAPRLVYADWLDERGDPRGEFIRVQCELARLPGDDPRQLSLRKREKQLRKRHGRQWAEPLPGRVQNWDFARGFVYWILVTPGQFLANAPSLFGQVP